MTSALEGTLTVGVRQFASDVSGKALSKKRKRELVQAGRRDECSNPS